MSIWNQSLICAEAEERHQRTIAKVATPTSEPQGRKFTMTYLRALIYNTTKGHPGGISTPELVSATQHGYKSVYAACTQMVSAGVLRVVKQRSEGSSREPFLRYTAGTLPKVVTSTDEPRVYRHPTTGLVISQRAYYKAMSKVKGMCANHTSRPAFRGSSSCLECIENRKECNKTKGEMRACNKKIA